MEIQQEQLFENNKNTENTDISIIKKYFPNCFDKNGNFLLEQFNSILKNSNITINKEYYSLNWLGKSYAKLLRDLPPETLIAEDNEHNSKVENQNSGNLLIQGDNLEVLKHLKNAYQEKVKMIYIDPPYNTGSDGFVYQDDRKFSKEQLSELVGIDLDEAQRILDFTDKKSNSHSAWLTFMYPRLYIARQLLKEDGVIFISIDDNEVAQLRLLCDEIFGEGNFVGEISRGTGTTTGQDANKIGSSLDYVLIYSKTGNFSIRGISLEEKDIKRFNKKDKKGCYSLLQLRKTGNEDRKEDRENMFYPVSSPDGLMVYPFGKDYLSRWRCSRNSYNDLVKENMIEWIEKEEPNFSIGEYKKSKWVPYVKFYLEGRTKQISNLLTNIDGNKKATIEIKSLFGAKKEIFLNPKPVQLLNYLIQMSCDNNDLILDFFAGSGTTADAVMQLNSEDGGNRQFILVQLPEKINGEKKKNKTAYDFVKNELGVENPTIFEITKERIIRSSKKILDENPEIKGDFGFKIYKTCENFCLKENELSLNQEMFPKIQFNDQEYQTLLTSWRLYDGEKLTEKIITIKFGDYIAYLCGKNLYLIYPHFESEQIKILIEMLDKNDDFSPNRIIFYGEHIESSKQKELQQALESYTNKKNLAINLLVRY
ncbi:type III restriction endonuclease subunit M [Bisgaardia hudsonensis]|nr:type III restriction endonuclease subunit M [Bisgaardia hudsonensis]